MLQQVFWKVIILTILSALTGCQHNEIMGRWESVEAQGGFASILEIQPDGKLNSLMAVRVDRAYRVEGDNVILTDPDGTIRPIEPTKQPAPAKKPAAKAKKSVDKKTDAKQEKPKRPSYLKENGKFYGEDGEPVIYVFVLDGDKLKMTHEETERGMDLRREDQAAIPGSIVGHWTYKHVTGQTAHMIFDANGILHFRMMLPGGVENFYKVKGDTITLYTADDQPTQEAKYKLEDGKLVLNFGNNITSFIRVSESSSGLQR